MIASDILEISIHYCFKQAQMGIYLCSVYVLHKFTMQIAQDRLFLGGL